VHDGYYVLVVHDDYCVALCRCHPDSCVHGNRESRAETGTGREFISRVKTGNQVFRSVFMRLFVRSFFFLLHPDDLG
jgi:hypothetical protein